MSDAAPRNRLAGSTSPYLLQHAGNPVDWYPWGDEAFAKARAEDKPVLLSIGYSSCHWCHVMAHESFEDASIAGLMNEHFVSVKVDREERPDIDDIYMSATLAMNHGQGGWPMTVFLTPDAEPFFAGTYFPPDDRWGRPGFPTLLRRIAALWKDDRASLVAQASHVVDALRDNARPAPGAGVGEEELRAARDQLARDFDERFGGFGGAPKFPPATTLRLLLRCWRRFDDPRSLEMVDRTLDAMARGGMYDQVGGGFCRYSTDERWLVPHFEKMLYDNALLAKAYLEGWQATGNGEFRRVAVEILDYALREMQSDEGGFYSSTDADSEGEEGRFFVWTPGQVREVLGEDGARALCTWYDITEHGNWEGRSIPNLPRSLEVAAKLLDREPAALSAEIEASRRRLYEARRRRVAPGLDDKVLTAWNGLMIGALAEGFRVLGDARYLEGARQAAGFVLARLRRGDGGLLRAYRAGTAHLDAYLEDYAFLAEGLVDLFEAGGDAAHLGEAEKLAERIVTDFASDEGGFYSTAAGHERLVVRYREGHDGAIPGANAVAAHVLARLSFHLGRAKLREQAERAIRAYGKAIARQPRAFAQALIAVDLLLDGPVELALVGAPGEEAFEALRREVGRRFVPRRIVVLHDPDGGRPPSPLALGKDLVDGSAALYVCRDFACERPITDPALVPAAVDAASAPRRGAERKLARRRLRGHATPEGTLRAAARLPASGSTRLGGTDWTTSRLGFGGYRVDDETPEHREALAAALGAGVNLVDTSANYTDGGSERLFGEVLGDLVTAGRLGRDEVVVVSKVGYVQGGNLERAVERERAGQAFPEVVKYGEGLWHCVHPDFLEDQLTRSLERLGLDTLDVLLLHNPEYFLMDAAHRREGEVEQRRREFYRRLEAAFGFLEGAATAGRIGRYGVSSNTCTRRADDPEATSLTRMLDAARAAGGTRHRFGVLQLPLNLFESGAVSVRNCGPGGNRTVLEEAMAHGIGVLVNRPLNAMREGGLLRLAEPGDPSAAEALEERLAAVETLEREFRDRIAPHVSTGEASVPPSAFFDLGRELRALVPRLSGVEHWSHVEASAVLPRLVQATRALDRGLGGRLGEDWLAWRGRYVPEVHRLLEALRGAAASRSAEALRPVRESLAPRLGERAGETLSRQALWVVASTPGVSSVLVGMRQPAYVRDALEVLAWPRVEGAADVYRSVAG